MKTYTFLTLAFIAFMFGAAATAIVMEQYLMPQTAQVNALITMSLGESQWTNNTLVDWGNVDPNTTYVWGFRVNNTCLTNITVTLHVSGLPAGWKQTWSANGTMLGPLGTEDTVIADLTLYVPPTAFGTATWDMWIEVIPMT